MEVLVCILLFIFIIGTVIGSFLNVVALRGLTGESIVLPPSKCPKCGNKIKPWHNIPILSYIFLGGKCAYCKEKISLQYPIVEFLTGLLLLGSFIKYGFTLNTLFIFIALATLLVMSITDIKEKVICAGHAWFLIVMGSIYSIILTYSQITDYGLLFKTSAILKLPIIESIFGLIAGVIIMELLARVGNLIIGQRAFGTGDTFIAAGLGMFFGWKALLFALVLSIAIQVAIVIPGFFKKLKSRNDSMTIVSIVLFLIAASGFSLANYYGLMEDFIICVIASIVLAIIGIWACVRVIKGMKGESNITILPFGPAMAIATMLYLFFLV